MVIGVYGLTGCSNDFDNYDAPNGGINGRVLDTETGEAIPLPVEGSTGVIINMHEQNTNVTQSVDFYAKYDGTFENSRIFNCDYRVVVNGPFVGTCEQNVTIKGQTMVEMKATPYARISASASISGTTAVIQYNVAKTADSFTVSDVYGYWNFAPGVDDGSANYAGKVTVTETSGTITFDLGSNSTYISNLHKIKANGNKIYLRVGAKTEGVINYSAVQTVVVN
jgi:hypothetical protein